MRVVWRTRAISKVYRRSHSARWRTTYERSTRDNRRASAGCCWDFLHCGPSRHKSLNSCSSSDWSARRRLTLWYVTCCSVEDHSTGRTCPFSRTVPQWAVLTGRLNTREWKTWNQNRCVGNARVIDFDRLTQNFIRHVNKAEVTTKC